MPIPDHLELDPDAQDTVPGQLRVKQGNNLCPECGADLTGMNPVNHSRSHWPDRWDPNNPPSAAAVARRKALEGMNTSGAVQQGQEP